MPDETPEIGEESMQALEALAGSRTPFIIGVRHHAPSLSARIETMLDEFKPECVLIELPMEFESWLQWLGAEKLIAPVALAAAAADGSSLAFYPYADFSPELSAIRWAVRNGVEVLPCDLPAGVRSGMTRTMGGHPSEPQQTITDHLQRKWSSEDFETLWDRAVEVHADNATPEALRRAGLYLGWALRHDAVLQGGVPEVDLMRETHMRSCLADAGAYDGRRVAAVVGAFHSPALLEEPQMWAETPAPEELTEMVTSLIPYSFELLDSRSSYPAGIRDPMWQQGVYDSVQEGVPVHALISDTVVRVSREMRNRGHVAGVPDAQAAVTMALQLAQMRRVAAPGRQEVVEAIQSAMARGEVMGRGRILARAMERVMIGRRRGHLAPKTPRSGLAPFVEELLSSLGLPGPSSRSEDPKEMRLDPLRNERDRNRHVTLRRLGVCGIPYGNEVAGQAIGATQTLTKRWAIRWEPGTDAVMELASIWGVTLEQAARGAIRAEFAPGDDEAEDADASRILALARVRAECGLLDDLQDSLNELSGPFLAVADLQRVLVGMAFIDELVHGHIPGCPKAETTDFPSQVAQREFLAAAIRAVEGIVGSTEVADARALIELISLTRNQETEETLGSSRLEWWLQEMLENGSPLMQGAASAGQMISDVIDTSVLSSRLSSWLDSASSPEMLRMLMERLRGTLVAGSSLLESDPACLLDFARRIHALDDSEFLRKLPALRGGFNELSPSGRGRMLEELRDAFPETMDPRGVAQQFVAADHPELLALWAEADGAGRGAVEALMSIGAVETSAQPADDEGEDADTPFPPANGELDILTRWRLILGKERDKLQGQASRAARALDELYGQRGEGSGRGTADGDGGGQEAGFPTARDWAQELEILFGDRIRDEVLGAAAAGGYRGAALELDAETITPSIELLETLLSLKGGMAESQLIELRKMVRQIIAALVQELATRLRPALTGIALPRPTLRKGGPIDLKRTIQANLSRAQLVDGETTIIPERVYFKTRAKRSMDWHVTLVVDVSGSMEPSVIYSAMMAAILSGLPAVETNFIAFNTEVIDLSEFVEDPLALLLEVEVGGGTHIAKALKYARENLTVPRRSIVVLVSDFEEGWGVEGLIHEVRRLAESGAHVLGLASLDDAGNRRYNNAIASLCAGAGMPVAALSPLELARWVGEKINGK